jgi:hypothetical protein
MTVADHQRSVIEDLDLGVPQHRTVIKFVLPYRMTAGQIARYLSKLVDCLGMELAVPGIVTAWCEHGLGGWAHITTSCIDFMEYCRLVDDVPVSFCTVDIYSCKSYDLHSAAAMTARHFEVPPHELRAYYVRLEAA